jgi:hypothetical protein
MNTLADPIVANTLTTEQSKKLAGVLDFVIDELFIAILTRTHLRAPYNLGVRQGPANSKLFDELVADYRATGDGTPLGERLKSFVFLHRPDTNSVSLSYAFDLHGGATHHEAVLVPLAGNTFDWHRAYSEAVRLISTGDQLAESLASLEELMVKMQGARMEFAFNR